MNSVRILIARTKRMLVVQFQSIKEVNTEHQSGKCNWFSFWTEWVLIPHIYYDNLHFVVEQNSDIGQLDKLLWTTLERIINIQNITPSHPVQVKLNVNIDVTPLSPWCWHSDQPSIDTLFSFPNPCPESLQGKHTDDKGLGPIITIIRAQPDKQTVTRQPVLLLGLTCHTTTVFAQLKLDCYSMRKFKVLFLLFNYFALWIFRVI